MPAIVRLLLVAFLVGAGHATPACAAGAPAGADSVFLEELTWTELRDRVRAGTTTIIVPIGGTEQSGPHMALGKHNVAGEGARRSASPRALGNALVAPGDRLCAGRQHRPADRPHALPRHDHHARRGVRDDARIRGAQLPPHGFRDIVLHRRPRRLPEEPGEGRRTRSTASGRRRRCASMRSRSTTAPPRSTTAALLRAHGYRATPRSAAMPGSPTPRSRWRSIRALVRPDAPARRGRAGRADGVHGDPRRASAELGQLGVDLIVARTVDAIRKRSCRAIDRIASARDRHAR